MRFRKSTLFAACLVLSLAAHAGSKMTIKGDDECELSVASESPHDPEIEKKFLSMMRSR